ncbi:MAG: hypothetical protein WCK90_04015 [archaeon]
MRYKKMANKCLYCKTDIREDAVLGVCKNCGVGVWGEKQYLNILSSMEKAKETGNLFQGSISDSSPRSR